MAAERLQVIADAFEAWNRGDYAGAVEHFSEDGEWHPYLGSLEASVYRGRDQLQALFGDLDERLGVRLELVSIEEVGDGALVCVRAQGSASGAEADAEWFQLYSFAGELIERVRPFGSRGAAVAAAEAEAER